MIGTITAQLKLTVNIPADMRWTSPGGLSTGGSASVTTNVVPRLGRLVLELH